jgi:hypothetical protein
MRKTPNRIKQFAARGAGWVSVPDDAEADATAAIDGAFQAVTDAFEDDGAPPPKALARLLEHTQTGLTRTVTGMVAKARKGASSDGVAARLEKAVKQRLDKMRALMKKHRLFPQNAAIAIELEFLEDDIIARLEDIIKGWK